MDGAGWPTWVANDNVFLSPDHLPYLQSRFEQQTLEETSGAVPYLPLVRVPYYVFVGRNAEEATEGNRQDAKRPRCYGMPSAARIDVAPTKSP